MESGGVGVPLRPAVHAAVDPLPHAPLIRPTDPRGPALDPSHKAGTPTMGGVIIVVAAVLGYLMGHLGTSIVFTRSGILAISVIVASGFLGFIDDYLEHPQRTQPRTQQARQVRRSTGHRRGRSRCLPIDWVHTSTNLSFTRFSLPGLEPDVGRMVRCSRIFVIIATSNAVNLTDGLDGLAAGSSDVLLRRALDHRLLAVPSLLDLPPARRARPRAGRGRSGRRAASASSGGTPRRRASSWATPGPSPSAPGSGRSVS